MPKFSNLLKPSRLHVYAAALLLPLTLNLAVQAAPAPASKTAAIHAGQELFTAKCMQCHAIQPDQVRLGPSLYGELKPPHPKKTEAQIREILKNGKGKMPPFGDKLSKADTDNILAYLHTL